MMRRRSSVEPDAGRHSGQSQQGMEKLRPAVHILPTMLTTVLDSPGGFLKKICEVFSISSREGTKKWGRRPETRPARFFHSWIQVSKQNASSPTRPLTKDTSSRPSKWRGSLPVKAVVVIWYVGDNTLQTNHHKYWLNTSQLFLILLVKRVVLINCTNASQS